MVLGRLLYFYFFFSIVFATSVFADTSANLTPISTGTWDGATYGTDPNDCCSNPAGSGALYDTSTNVIKFSYGYDTVAKTIAIQQALQQSGISVDGFQYHWHYKMVSNSGTTGDTLVFTVEVTDSNNNLVETYQYDYSNEAIYDQWIHQAGTELFKQSYLDPQSITLKIQGKDGGYWAGLYGPEVNYTDLRLIYSADPCATNPLYDPSCSGYAEAYAQLLYDQQCAANPLYDSGCPGYTQAYYTQQCLINPLYDSSCPGYDQAYYDQQCSLDPLYDTGCTGYAQAYLDQQCSLDALYDSSCPGYETAYYETYIKPGLEAQAAEASGTSTDTARTITETVATSDPVAELTTVSTTGNSTVDAVLNDTSATTPVVDLTATLETPAVEPTTTVSETVETTETETEAQESEAQEEMVASLEVESDTTEESTSESSEESSEEDSTDSDNNDGDKKSSKKEKMKKAIAKKASQLAERMSNAASMEAQRDAQNYVMALIGFNPDFTTYKAKLPDAAFYSDPGLEDKRLPTNPGPLRNGLAQQILHEKMVDMQYGDLK